MAGDELRIVAVDLENEAISNAWLALRPHAVAVVIGVTSSASRPSSGQLEATRIGIPWWRSRLTAAPPTGDTDTFPLLSRPP